MKRRPQGIYICLAVVMAALLSTIMIHMLCEKKVQKQSQVESNLPTGDYLPDAECPLIRVVIKTNGFQGIAHPKVEVSVQG